MMSKTKIRVWCAVFVLLLASAAAIVDAPAESSWKRIIVKSSPEDLDRIRAMVGAAIVDAGHGHFVLAVPASTDTKKIEAIGGNGAVQAEDDLPVSLLRRTPRTSSERNLASTSLGPVVDWFGTPARAGYANQAAGAQIDLRNALRIATGKGLRVAIIDTGVDERHPTLKSVIWGGKNYVGRTVVPSEFDDPHVDQSSVAFLDQSSVAFLDQSSVAFLDQSSVAFLDQSSVAFLDQSSVAFLDQSSVAFLDQSSVAFLDGVRRLPAAFGHGTMMAGLVHFAAPHARIIPLKAFDASGWATEWNVVRAIYDAVDMDADVISMSFSSPNRSRLIETALRFAASKGVILVGSAGNDNLEVPTYPASLDEAVGISAVDSGDRKAVFSNFGTYVDLSAPGVDLITTYPGGHWVMSSGTSDSVPLVSGVFALAKQSGARGASLRQKVVNSADKISAPPEYRNKLGRGRINAYKAVLRGDSND